MYLLVAWPFSLHSEGALMKEQPAAVHVKGSLRTAINSWRLTTGILSLFFFIVSISPLVRSISTGEHPHFIFCDYEKSVRINPLLLVNTFHERYRAKYERENDSSDLHTLIDKLKAIQRNIFSCGNGKILNRITSYSDTPKKEYISRKASIKMRHALLPVSFWLLIDCCLHNTSPPS